MKNSFFGNSQPEKLNLIICLIYLLLVQLLIYIDIVSIRARSHSNAKNCYLIFDGNDTIQAYIIKIEYEDFVRNTFLFTIYKKMYINKVELIARQLDDKNQRLRVPNSAIFPTMH